MISPAKDSFTLLCSPADPAVLENAAEFLQSAVWARQKSQFGWTAQSFLVEQKGRGELSFPLLVLLRKFGIFHIAYIPHAPALKVAKGAGISPAAFLAALTRALKPHLPTILQIPTTLFIRFDLNWNLPDSPDSPNSQDSQDSQDVLGLEKGGLKKSPVDIQPPDTVILPISLEKFSEEDILGQMKPKTRYNIRLASRRGVEVEQVPRRDFQVPPAFDDWYELYRITEKRNNIALHSRNYYANLFAITKSADCRLYIARHETDLLAGIIVVIHKRQGRYLYGASSNHKRNHMPAYALQWRAICDLRREGVETYDFFGIPPVAYKGHPMFGLYQFKTGFGGEIIHSPAPGIYPSTISSPSSTENSKNCETNITKT